MAASVAVALTLGTVTAMGAVADAAEAPTSGVRWVTGRVDAGPPVVGADVQLRSEDGKQSFGEPTTSDERGRFTIVAPTDLPTTFRVEAKQGTADGKPVGTPLAAIATAPTGVEAVDVEVNVATSLVVAYVDAKAVDDAAAAQDVKKYLDVPPDTDLGRSVSDADVAVDQQALLKAATSAGGLGALAEDVSAGRTRPFHGDLPVNVGGIPDEIAKLVLKSAGDMAMAQLGLDSKYNALLQISRQLEAIMQTLTVINQKLDDIIAQLKIDSYQNAWRAYRIAYFDGIEAGGTALSDYSYSAGQLGEAKTKGASKEQIEELEAATDARAATFKGVCRKHDYFTAVNALATNFHTPDSLLQHFLDAMIVPRRFITKADAEELSNTFYQLYGEQHLAARLHAECLVATNQTKPEGAFAAVYKQGTGSGGGILYHAGVRQQNVFKEPDVLPRVVPDGYVVDLVTRNVWLDEQHALAGTPRVDLFYPKAPPLDLGPKLAPSITRQGPTGNWEFTIPSVSQLDDVLRLRGTQKPLAWRLSAIHASGGASWPSGVKDLLVEIGLKKALANVPVAGDSAYLWTRDFGDRYEVCYGARGFCDAPRKWAYKATMNPNIGISTSPQSGTQRYPFPKAASATFLSAGDMQQWFARWKASTVYAAPLAAGDRFAVLDLKPIGG